MASTAYRLPQKGLHVHGETKAVSSLVRPAQWARLRSEQFLHLHAHPLHTLWKTLVVREWKVARADFPLCCLFQCSPLINIHNLWIAKVMHAYQMYFLLENAKLPMVTAT